MASKTTGPESVPERSTIEQLRLKYKTPAAIHAGAMALVGWRPGKLVTAAEYEAVVRLFRAGAAKGGTTHVK